MSKVEYISREFIRLPIRDKFSILLGRLLNLADSITDDKERRNAIKGLIKDFVNHAHCEITKEIEKRLEKSGVLDKKNDSSIPPPTILK